jgi:hypothetical protein
MKSSNLEFFLKEKSMPEFFGNSAFRYYTEVRL